MADLGWIILHRKIMDSEDWLSEPFTRGQAWVDLIMLANHKTGYVRKRGILIEVKRGQVAHSEDALAKRWKWSRGKVRRFLDELKMRQQIERETVQKNPKISSLITLINYDQYQSDGTTNGTKDGTTNGHQTVQGTKNVKNIFSSDSIEFRLAELLLKKIISRNQNFRKPNIQSWAKHIDYMVRLDNRTPEEIRNVIEWCQSDSFWKSNILSTSKLRERFDQLLEKMPSFKVASSW